ncbi:uncharacterized protein LOC128862404 isoform X1 [Anastrepha ludens]|uniref:uncharacterized protein LOC128862404 isoform X1 n=1 Tax=Anastrepha ludens TaxID=28586 RepID=UPI0023B1FF71|nr:uncharacterized protein LOC128862404 isoform X1 [Anastrepha ludens]XP_053956971.1 uncharacterized protein LOC128862404 isoform X1 [Anastrepha ludens]
MDRPDTDLSNLSDSLGVLNLDNFRVFGDTSNSSTTSGKPVNERLNKERLKALETLEKANKSMKSDVNKIIQQNFTRRDYLKVQDAITPSNTSSKLNRTEYVPYHRPDSINISDLVTDESINLDFKSTVSTNSTNVSFEPSEITGRSTHYTERKSQKISKNSIDSKSCRLSVGDILATSFAPKARNLVDILGERTSVSSTSLGSLNNSQNLLRTADLSCNTSESTFSKAVGLPFSFNATNDAGLNEEEFEPAEKMHSKLLMDEIAWAQEFATIPTAGLNKGGKEKMPDGKDFDLLSNPNSSLLARDPNFSMGRFFNQRSEDLQNIVESLSPERMRQPIALVDDTQSTLSLSTPIGNTKVFTSTNDPELTPQIDNRAYSRVPNAAYNSVLDSEKQNLDKQASKDSGNVTKEEEESYLLSLSHIKKAFIKNVDADISSTGLIDLLKNPKRNKSPKNGKELELQNKTDQKSQSSNPQKVAVSPKDTFTNASIRQSVEQYTNSLNTLEELLSENKENLDPQKMRGSESQADTISFTESLLDASDLKELQRSTTQPRPPLSPLNIPTIRLSPDEIDYQEKFAQRCQKTPEMLDVTFKSTISKSPTSKVSRRIASTLNNKTTTKMDKARSTSPLSPSLQVQQKPLSSTRLDDQKSDCDFVATSPNLTETLASPKRIHAKRTLLSNGSPYSGLTASLPSPPRSYMSSQPSSPAPVVNNISRRTCENCSPQISSNTQTISGVRVHRSASSPSASEASAKSVVPMRTSSAQSLRNGSGNVGFVRSVSRCSSNSEFSHRDGNSIPLKITAVELSWGSTRLRSAAHKTMQVKNTASKKLTLRIDVHGPGYQMVNMPSNNTLTLQTQECRTITVSFCPTVIGAAVGKLSFYAPQNTNVAHNSASTASMLSFLDIPLYGYGGHCSIVAQEVHIAPVGMAFLQMGYLHELSQPMQRTIRVYNKGPLLGFALASIDSVGLRLPRLCTAFEIQPAAMLIPPGSTATLRVIFRPQREDVRKITRQTKSVLTLANLRLISGDEANRQRMRLLVERMSAEERANVSSSKSLEALWQKLPGEKDIKELQIFKESPKLTYDLLTHMRIHEVALTINDDYLDETIKSTSSLYFPDEDETVLFRTVCSPSSSHADGSGNVLDRVDELTEEEIEHANSNNSSTRAEACCWSVLPSAINFYLRDENHTARSSIFICNSFKSRQYFEVSTNRKNLLKLTPSEGYVEPDGGHLEVEVHLLCDKLNSQNRQEPIYITVSMENERFKVPVQLCDGAHAPECV